MTPAFLRTLLRGAGRGRVLFTCRYPLPGLSNALSDVTVAPLSRAQTRKLILRLPGINALEPAQQAHARALTGGHPRLLELIDAVLRGNPKRLTSMAVRLTRHAATLGVDLHAGRADLDQARTLALDLQLLDIALTELLDSLPRQPREVLLQAAVSTIPITVTGLTETLTAAEDWSTPEIAAACDLLAHRTLMTKTGSGDEVFIERWTAEGLRARDDPDRWRQRSQRAAQYRVQQLQESGNVEYAMEAARNLVAAQDYEQAAQRAAAAARWLNANGHSITSASFAAEILTVYWDGFMRPDEAFDDSIPQKLSDCGTFAILVSEDTWDGQHYASEELAVAVNLARQRQLAIIPVWLSDILVERRPYGISTKAGISLERYDGCLGCVAGRLVETVLRSKIRAECAVTATGTGSTPWPGRYGPGRRTAARQAVRRRVAAVVRVAGGVVSPWDVGSIRRGRACLPTTT